MSSNRKSFMIDDILRSEDTKKEDGNREEPGRSETISHYNFIMNDFYSQFHNAQSRSQPHPSSVPLMQGKRSSYAMALLSFYSSEPSYRSTCANSLLATPFSATKDHAPAQASKRRSDPIQSPADYRSGEALPQEQVFVSAGTKADRQSHQSDRTSG